MASDGYLALASAIWYYMTPVPPKPSMHEIVTGFYVPNAYDTSQGITSGFGATINMLWDDECGGATESADAAKRISYYTSWCSTLAVPVGDNTSCAGMKKFSDESSSAFPDIWFKKAYNVNRCDQTDEPTPYSIFATRDYMRCICDSWGGEVTDCLTEVTTNEGDKSGAMAVASTMAVATWLVTALF